jgi:hypothetical protein
MVSLYRCSLNKLVAMVGLLSRKCLTRLKQFNQISDSSEPFPDNRWHHLRNCTWDGMG